MSCHNMDLQDGIKDVPKPNARSSLASQPLHYAAKTEFDLFKDGENSKFATAKEDSDFCCRMFLAPYHSFTMSVVEKGSDDEILAVDRPFVCCAACSCCCFQKMKVTSGGQDIGSIKETCYFCVPRFEVLNASQQPVYKMHQPTCVGGMCVNCCAEGNPCGPGCCKVPFHVFPADQKDTDNGAQHSGKILKMPRSWKSELFTDADVFEVSFPEGATSEQKGLLVGASIFLNAIFFEGENEGAA